MSLHRHRMILGTSMIGRGDTRMNNKGILLMREPLPDRRRSWTQKVRIEGQTCYLTVGEYDDGRPGEIFIDVSKAGTFIKGIIGQLARSVSIALQCGADLPTVLHMLRGHDYPPHGTVEGDFSSVSVCTSVMDWVAGELEGAYMRSTQSVGEGDAIPAA